MDPVQFGLLMIMCSMIGLLTPPVGMVLFAISSVSGVRVGALVRELWPFLIALVVVTLAVAYIPAVSTWLPTVVAPMSGSALGKLDQALGLMLRGVPIACLLALGSLLTANIVGRYSGAFSFPWFDEVVTGLFAWMVFIGRRGPLA